MDEHLDSRPKAEHAVLGIEFGSTRIKAVLIDRQHRTLAAGSYLWENRLKNGLWTYSLDEVWHGLQECYRNMAEQYAALYGGTIDSLAAIGFSGMMHGYLPFDKDGELLVPFRTWRNTVTGPASEELTGLLGFHIPQRWSIAHLYQAILWEEPHVPQINFLTTLAGYVHWKLTGRRVLGVGEASGMFPIDSRTGTYDRKMAEAFDARIAGRNYPWKLLGILPETLTAGQEAGRLTPEGAGLLDPSGVLRAGIPLCPPEGDAGTGMAATNSVAPRTGNVSAGTSIFAMLVLEKELRHVYPEIDVVTTPDGLPVAMVHCNNCTSEINAWAALFQELAQSLGQEVSSGSLYPLLFQKALEGETDCGGVLCCGYLSGEPIAGLAEGRPLLVRKPESRLTLGNFMRAQLYSTVATLKLGMDLLLENEQVKIERLMGHGGLFKTPKVGQGILAAAAGVPVSVLETAGEGGAWGAALLADYMKYRTEGQSLASYLNGRVFGGMTVLELAPDPAEREGFERYMASYRKLLAVEKAAADTL